VKNALWLSLLLALLTPSLAWSAGVPICFTPENQSNPGLVSSVSGSGILAWSDQRQGGYGADVFVQRINSSAVPEWTSNGVHLTTTGQASSSPEIAPDGAGGAIMAWSSYADGGYSDIFAQRVDASGTALWTAGGILICNQLYDEWVYSIVSDGAGGAIIVWEEAKSSVIIGSYIVRAQRVDGSGVRLWTAAGVLVSGVGLEGSTPRAASDGAGGVIIAWTRRHLNPSSQFEYDGYVQRINAAGATLWADGGASIGTFPGNQYPSTITPDDAGGAIVVWEDYRNDINGDLFMQRLRPVGTVMWDPNGVALATATGSQHMTDIMPDGAGGAFMLWDSKSRVWLQRVNSNGVEQYVTNGVMVSKYESGSGQFTTDSAGGVIATWSDLRNVNAVDSYADLYAQRFSGSGVPLWTSWGVPVCTEPKLQFNEQIIPNGSGGALIVWQDWRNENVDIFGQGISANGVLTVATAVRDTRTPSLVVGEAHPNPFAENTTLDVELSGSSPVSVEMFDVAGRRVRAMTPAQKRAGMLQIVIDGRDQNAQLLPSGVYFCRIHAGAETITRKMVIAR